MLLADVVATSTAVGATRSRRAKVAAIAELLARTDPAEAGLVTAYLSGVLRQRRTGLGWRALQDPPPAADAATLDVVEVDAALEQLAALAGGGSRTARRAALDGLLARATGQEQSWLQRVIGGEVRQGALDAIVQEGVALAAAVPVEDVRRAAMFAGSTPAVATALLREGPDALARFRLEVGRPVHPMLASSAVDVAAALDRAGEPGTPVAVDQKLDGIRIQVHKDGDDVLVATRSLDDITARVPEVVEVVRGLPARTLVLDGEAISLDETGRPRAFQDTASRTASGGAGLTPYFFDLLLVDDRDLVDAPTTERIEALATLVPEAFLVPRLVTADLAAAEAFLADTLHGGHEGVVVKSLSAPYAAGRRGSAWVKVKPVHTVDLVVLAVEPGSGRRQGWLSNIHLGARDAGTGELVMVGKTFKGMTDAMLAWQTERFTELAVRREAHVVELRPEQVVEIAFDGVQRSRRYAGGVALRFARVVRYRDDKTADEADTLDTLRSLGGG